MWKQQHNLNLEQDTHIFTRSPSLSSAVSSLSGEQCPTMLHSKTALSLSFETPSLVGCQIPKSSLSQVRAVPAQHCKVQRVRMIPAAHLFTETHVGKATPFSMLFPLNTLATALRRHSFPQQRASVASDNPASLRGQARLLQELGKSLTPQ